MHLYRVNRGLCDTPGVHAFACACDQTVQFLHLGRFLSNFILGFILGVHLHPGLEKLTNANWSVSTGNDGLFPVELMEIADWKSMSEYMLHSNFGKILTRDIGGNFGAYTFILPLPFFLNICLPFWMFY